MEDLKSAKERSDALLGRAPCVQLTTIGEDGWPVTKAFLPPLARSGLKTLWFSTNTGSRKIARIESNPKACVYVCDPGTYEGLALTGELEIVKDPEIKAGLWKEGFETYYPKGPEDPDYCVLRFMAKDASYYNNLRDVSWKVD